MIEELDYLEKNEAGDYQYKLGHNDRVENFLKINEIIGVLNNNFIDKIRNIIKEPIKYEPKVANKIFNKYWGELRKEANKFISSDISIGEDKTISIEAHVENGKVIIDNIIQNEKKEETITEKVLNLLRSDKYVYVVYGGALQLECLIIPRNYEDDNEKFYTIDNTAKNNDGFSSNSFHSINKILGIYSDMGEYLNKTRED